MPSYDLIELVTWGQIVSGHLECAGEFVRQQWIEKRAFTRFGHPQEIPAHNGDYPSLLDRCQNLVPKKTGLGDDAPPRA